MLEKKISKGPVEKEPAHKIEPKKVEKKKGPEPDYSKLTLEEFHNLPQNRECRELLARADMELKKRPVIKVMIKTVKGLSEADELDLENVFYLEPEAEKYPLDSSIRSYHCPQQLEDVKVLYTLKKGPGFSSLYQFTYYGDRQGINVSNPSNPEGQIESRLGDNPPSLTLNIDRMEVESINPSYTFSNKDIDFILENIGFGIENHVNIRVKNKTDKNLAIRKFRMTIGGRDVQVDFKKDILKLKPGETISKNGIKAGRSTKKWFVSDGGKQIMVVARVVYQAGWDIKKLQGEKYVKIGDLGINQEIKKQQR